MRTTRRAKIIPQTKATTIGTKGEVDLELSVFITSDVLLTTKLNNSM